MPQCAVLNCFNTHRKTKGKIRYHRFPSDTRTRSRWLDVCGRYVQNCATARVCSKHFSTESYERDLQHEILGLPTRCRLRKGAVPDINIPTTTSTVATTAAVGTKTNRGDRNGQPYLTEATTTIANGGGARGTGRGGGIAVLLAVGLMPAKTYRPFGVSNGDLIKRHAMEENQETSQVALETQEPSSITQEVQNHSTENGDDSELHKSNLESQKSSPENSSDEYPQKKDPDFHEDITENGTCSNEDTADRITEDEKGIQENRNNCKEPANGKVNKRKKEDEDSTVKKLRSEVQQSYSVRNKIFNELIDSPACKTVDQIQSRIERIVLEIRTLNDIALEKEREWNSIIHLRKLKEELLLRMQRRKQVMLYNSRDLGDTERSENCLDINQGSRSPQQLGHKSSNYHEGGRQQNTLNALSTYVEMNGHSNESKNIKQRPVIDVQSIIADYRQRHPETVPRRGRRIRSSLTSQQNEIGSRFGQSGTMNFTSMALGSGSQMKHNINNKMDVNSELGMFFSAIENSKQNGSKLSSSSPELQGSSDEPSFKDVLMQFAKLSQNDRCELIQNALKPPPPYPEVTVHPVPVTTPQQKNSLLHGILTQAQPKTESKTTFSPTLARLLTAPERSVASTMAANVPASNNLLNNAGNVSISDILSHNKARHEITITPVGAQYELNNKPKIAAQTDEDETEDSADRLVIDEGEGNDRNRGDNGSDAGDEVPQCQGCNQQPAQFVCAGCGNQWYCSRDCQVSAWDEHSEVCSG